MSAVAFALLGLRHDQTSAFGHSRLDVVRSGGTPCTTDTEALHMGVGPDRSERHDFRTRESFAVVCPVT